MKAVDIVDKSLIKLKHFVSMCFILHKTIHDNQLHQHMFPFKMLYLSTKFIYLVQKFFRKYSGHISEYVSEIILMFF